MPALNIYFRDDTYDFLKDVPNRSDFLNDLVRDRMRQIKNMTQQSKVEDFDKEINHLQEMKQTMEERERKEMEEREQRVAKQRHEAEEKRKKFARIISEYAKDNYDINIPLEIAEGFLNYMDTNDKATAEDFLLEQGVITEADQDALDRKLREEQNARRE